MSKPTVLVLLTILIAGCDGSRVKRTRVSSDLESNAMKEEMNRSIEDATEEQVIQDFAEEYSNEEEGLDEEDGNSTEGSGCRNYCVACNDGSTVWYGRDRNWFKMGASAVLGMAGGAAVASGVGLIGGAAIGAGAGVMGAGAAVSSAEETHTHWSGNLPTSGFFCEKVDVIKFPKFQSCNPQFFMERSKSRFGRVKNNQLKPYDTKGTLMAGKGYTQGDMTAYKKGCKVVKASGTNAFKQLSLGKLCKKGTTKGIHQCSTHSMLCGAAGVAGTSYAKSADKCRKTCEDTSTMKLQCPAKPQNGNGYSNQQYNPNGYNNQQYNPNPGQNAYNAQPAQNYPQQNYGTAQTYQNPPNQGYQPAGYQPYGVQSA